MPIFSYLRQANSGGESARVTAAAYHALGAALVRHLSLESFGSARFQVKKQRAPVPGSLATGKLSYAMVRTRIAENKSVMIRRVSYNRNESEAVLVYLTYAFGRHQVFYNPIPSIRMASCGTVHPPPSNGYSQSLLQVCHPFCERLPRPDPQESFRR